MERLSLDLLEQKKLLQMTKKMQEDFFESSNIFQQELQKIVQESKNQRFTDILVKILGDYNQWVGGVLKDNILEAWKTSSEGLSAVAQKYHAGKEADATAKKITHLIEENSEVKKTFKPLDLPDTSHPILSEEYYERMENAVQKYVNSLGRKKDQIKRQLNRQKEENMAFACLIGICESIYTTAIAFWSRQKEEIEKEHEKYNHNMKKKQVEAANLADTMEKAAVLRAGANLASEKSLTNGGSKSAESCDEVGGETSDDSVGQDASKEDQAVKEPYLSCLRKFMERFQKEPGNVKVFHDLATYMLEIARDLNKEDSYYTDEETADILRKLMIIAESYVMFGNREFDILSGEDSWKNCVDYQYFPTFINRYEDYFQENDYEDYTQGMYKPEYYDRVARQIQNMCKLSCEPGDIEEITRLYVEILNKKLALSQEKKKEYPNFSRLASRQIQKILNGEEVQAENVSVYGELVDVAMKLSKFGSFRELTEKIYNIVCNDMVNSVLRITPEMIIQIMPIYEEFYQDFGTVLKVETAPKSLNAFGEEELVKVTEDRGNVKFFDEGEWNDYQVAARQGMAQKYDCAARMEKNIANAYASGKANTMNLIYGMYVALIPIMNGRLRINDDSFSKFCSKATDRLLEILGRTDIINNNKSIKHIKNIAGSMQQDFASMKPDKKPIEQVIRYANADNLVNDIFNFSSAGCKYKGNIQSLYNDRLNDLEKYVQYAGEYIKDKYKNLWSDYQNTLQKDLDNKRNSLERSYINRIIEAVTGREIFQKYIDKANSSKIKKSNELNQQYNAELAKMMEIYKSKRQVIENEKNNSLSAGPTSKCVDLYNNKNAYVNNIYDSRTRKEWLEKVLDIRKICKQPCESMIKIFQEAYLSAKPSVKGFSGIYWGHRITINEKSRYWIDSELREDETQIVSMDGILNMKTPVHEYLHYLTTEEDGTSGVRSETIINAYAEKYNIFKEDIEDAMRGFNEGITEMFAQDYLKKEFASNNDFISPNEILKNEKEIYRAKCGSYKPQVDIIRAMYTALGSSDSIKKAYITHDFSIIENEINNKLSSSGGSINWKEVIMDMAKIQRNYTDHNPDGKRKRTKEIIDLRCKIVRILKNSVEESRG